MQFIRDVLHLDWLVSSGRDRKIQTLAALAALILFVAAGLGALLGSFGADDADDTAQAAGPTVTTSETGKHGDSADGTPTDENDGSPGPEVGTGDEGASSPGDGDDDNNVDGNNNDNDDNDEDGPEESPSTTSTAPSSTTGTPSTTVSTRPTTTSTTARPTTSTSPTTSPPTSAPTDSPSTVSVPPTTNSTTTTVGERPEKLTRLDVTVEDDALVNPRRGFRVRTPIRVEDAGANRPVAVRALLFRSDGAPLLDTSGQQVVGETRGGLFTPDLPLLAVDFDYRFLNLAAGSHTLFVRVEVWLDPASSEPIRLGEAPLVQADVLVR